MEKKFKDNFLFTFVYFMNIYHWYNGFDFMV